MDYYFVYFRDGEIAHWIRRNTRSVWRPSAAASFPFQYTQKVDRAPMAKEYADAACASMIRTYPREAEHFHVYPADLLL